VDRNRTRGWIWFTHHSPWLRGTLQNHLLERCLIVTFCYFSGFDFFDPRRVVVLQVCHICPPARPLPDPTSGIPMCHDLGDRPEEVGYPCGSRYTLQWVATPSTHSTRVLPNNRDAAFKKRTKDPKPSDLSLHYNIVDLCLSPHQQDHRGLYTIGMLQSVNLMPPGMLASLQQNAISRKSSAYGAVEGRCFSLTVLWVITHLLKEECEKAGGWKEGHASL